MTDERKQKNDGDRWIKESDLPGTPTTPYESPPPPPPKEPERPPERQEPDKND
jgi:hypothetical protein